MSGGAARGFAHIGVIKAFEESGITIDYVAGSSMGAVVGAFYAAGRTPDEMLQIAMKLNGGRLKPLLPFHFRKYGLDYVEQLLEENVVVRTFEELKKPLYVAVTNLQSGKNEIVSSGKLYPAVKASAAIPFRFKEQRIDDVIYVDGGLTNNLPANALREQCTVVVGVSVNPIDGYIGNKLGLKQKIRRLAGIVFAEFEARNIALCDYHLEIAGLEKYGFEEYHAALAIHDLGYHAAKTFLAEHPELVTAHR
ncbi:hypothetical protein FACS1894199_18620 [Bacteroidia bacterium]|nr:hypothetical protein FACS1894199_18620 [Bacteroidia bacterium]